MTAFLAEIIAFPTVIFTGMLGLALFYWIFVILGAIGIDAFDVDVDGLLEGGADGAVDAAVDGALDAAVLERTAMMVICSPANPQGAVADRAYLTAAIGLARRHGFILVVDECYAEIYDAEPPPGALEICAEIGDGFEGVVVFHSLSKRSNAAGLRSGFVAGDEAVIAAFKALRVFSSAMVPLPVMAAATALWNDEAHVVENRDRYRAKFDLATEFLGRHPGFYRPAGAFYLWLDVGDGEAAARRLWGDAAIRVLPGGYMALPDGDGINPGAPYVRIALVHDLDVLGPALERMAKVLA